MRHGWSVVGIAVVLAACAMPPLSPKPSERTAASILREELLKAAPVTPPIRAGVESPVPEEKDPLGHATVTLRGADIPLGEALVRLARPTGLTLVIEPEVDAQSPVNLDLHTVPARDALRVVLSPFGYTFRVERADLIVYAFETRTWMLSMPPDRAEWEQTITNQATSVGSTQQLPTTTGQVTPTAPTPTTGTSVVRLGSHVALTRKGEEFSFWKDVDEALKRMVTPKGWYVLNRLAGTATVRERPERLAELDRYFQSVESEVARQVQIEVKVIEVTLTSRDTLGIDWSQVYSQILGNGVLTQGTLSLGLQSTGQLLTGATLPLTAILQRGSDQLVIKALGQQGTVRTLAQPKLLISNNHPAVIQIGEVRSFIASLTTTLTGVAGASQTSASLGEVQDGVIVGIMPRIYGRDVVMAVTPVLTKVNQIRTIPLSSDNTSKIEAPDLNNRALSTTVRVPDGGMAVLGGLLNEEDRTNEAGLPWLRRIPVLGWLLFGFHDQQATRSEVVLMLTPTIVSPATFLAPAPPPAPVTPPPPPESPRPAPTNQPGRRF